MTGHRSGAPLRLVAVGDVGRSTAYHVGDEAMLLGLIETAKHGPVPVEWTVMATDPVRVAAEWGVRATSRLTFEDCAGSVERETRLATLDQLLQTPPARWLASVPDGWREPLTAIAECDGVIIGGGGNLSRSWPAEVFERTAVARAAQHAGHPVAISSQTIGPHFDDRSRQLTASLLRGGVLVGLREASSYDLAIELGSPGDRTVLQFDDATGVPPQEPPWWRDVARDGQFIAVTLNQLEDPGADDGIVGLLARQLVEVSRCTGAAVVIVPHVGDLHGPPAHDVAMAQAISAAAGDSPPLRIAPLPTPAQAIWIAARAELVVSTRYHPIVFATAMTTPALLLDQDHYTFVKGCGALSLAGLGSWTLPVAAAVGGLLVPAVMELWTRRHAVRGHLQQVAPTIETTRRRHVGDLLSVLASPESWSAGETIRVTPGPVARGEWVERAHNATAGVNAAAVRIRAVEQQLAAAEEYVRALTSEVDRKETALVVAQAALADLTKATREAHLAWRTDRESLLRHCEALEGRALVAEQWAGTLATEVERKETDLKIAIAALQETARRQHVESSGPAVEEPEPPAGSPSGKS